MDTTSTTEGWYKLDSCLKALRQGIRRQASNSALLGGVRPSTMFLTVNSILIPETISAFEWILHIAASTQWPGNGRKPCTDSCMDGKKDRLDDISGDITQTGIRYPAMHLASIALPGDKAGNGCWPVLPVQERYVHASARQRCLLPPRSWLRHSR